MLFNSISFLIFFPIVTLGYFLLPDRARWAWLLTASCVFYMAYVPKFILILFFLIGVDYIAGIVIENAQGPRRKASLVVSLIANLGILFFFKYFNFFTDNLAAVSRLLDWNLDVPVLAIVLPIGLSFHTFQSMSYTIEVYFGHQKAERHLGIYALYVMFYPQLVAGPIERPHNMLHQFRETHRFNSDRVWDGLTLMLVGLFKKVVIADRLAVLVNEVYAQPARYSGVPVVAAVFFFSIQIFCDFSGYTDIARGAARVMGFEMTENFNRPYMSKSVDEFWRRWHMSLMSWFRDYVFTPFAMARTAGGKRSVARMYWGIVLVFLLSGLWHGPAWKYVLFGALHGSVSIVLLAGARRRATLVKALGLERLKGIWTGAQVAVTFLFVTLTFVVFRADSVSTALYLVTHMWEPMPGSGWDSYRLSIDRLEFAFMLALALLVLGAQIYEETRKTRVSISELPKLTRWGLRYALAVSIIFLRPFAPQQFIYFQF